jgi:hypothetical protein
MDDDDEFKDEEEQSHCYYVIPRTSIYKTCWKLVMCVFLIYSFF